jgi:hypothetical protein
LKHTLILIAVAFATPAAASFDMSSAEFFERARTGNWVQPTVTETFTQDTPKHSENRGKNAVADMVAKETTKQIGAQWVSTALKLAKIESGFNCKAIGPRTRHGNARGVLQVMPGSARALGYDPRRLNECQHGIAAGVAHMSACLKSGVRTHAQMASCHVAGTRGWKVRLNARSERYKQKYVRMAAR